MTEQRDYGWNERGFTLTELMVVIAIIAILLSLSAFEFHQWQIKSQVEAQTRQMVSDLSDIRLRALTSKLKHSITINGNSYQFKWYTNEDDLPAGGTVLPGTHSVKYQLRTNSTTPFSGQIYEIDPRGLIDIDPGVFPNEVIPVYLAYDGATATVDCVNIHVVRVTAGKKNASGDNCDER